MQIACSCGGRNEKCCRCYGIGSLERFTDNRAGLEAERSAREAAKIAGFADPPPRKVSVGGKTFIALRQIS